MSISPHSELLFKDEKTEVIRAKRSDGIFIFKSVFAAGDEDKEIVKHEYNVLKKIKSPYVIQAIAVEDQTLILEDSTDVCLANVLGNITDIKSLLKIAINLAQGLAEIHNAHVIHKDINPSNILIDLDTFRIKYIDFGISSLLPREVEQFLNLTKIEGTLGYISPEQTGRMNRHLDYRTDIYSLGITLYHIFTKKLPFESTSNKNVIHMHIAKHAIPPHEINKTIPKMVSEIILKCMAKGAEDRYQSALGLKTDLENCLSQLEAQNSIEFFQLGKNDVNDQFHLPTKLYGRDAEIKMLYDNYQKVKEGSLQVLFVKGYTGIGKSTLINELQQPAEKENGLFVSGKFDQFNRNVAYDGLTKIFKALIEQLYLKPEEELLIWKEKIQDALEQNGQIIVDIIPNIEGLIGKQPPLLNLEPIEANNRFNIVVTKFLNVFLVKNRPMVMFMDDLQWADEYSLKYIDYFLSSGLSYLFFIGSYRDNEVTASHPLTLLIKQLEANAVPIQTCEILPLTKTSIHQLISDTFRCSHEVSTKLCQLLLKKTRGNPFFINHFLKYLFEEGLFVFDLSSQSWIANFAGIERLSVTDNVADLMSKKIAALDPSTQNILKNGALIGQTFDILLAAELEGISLTEATNAIQPALQEEFIFKVQAEHYYMFGHDRVQQAAYELLNTKDKESLHYRVGQILLTRTSQDKLSEKIVEITDHLNKGRGLILDPREIRDLINLNLAVGKKMKDVGAFHSAISYFNSGLLQLEKENWDHNYNLNFELHYNLAQCEQLVGNTHCAENLFNLLISKSRTVQEKVQIYMLQILLNTQQKLHKEAIASGLKALKLLNFSIPENPSLPRLIFKLMHVKFLMWFYSSKEMKSLPECKNEEVEKIIRVLYMMNASATFCNRYLFYGYLILKTVQLILKHGFSSYGLFWFAVYYVSFDQPKNFQHFKRLLEVLERYPKNIAIYDAHFGFYLFVNRWGNTYKSCAEGLKKLTHTFFERGHIQISTTCISGAGYYMFLAGNSLDSIIKYLEISIQEFYRYHTSGMFMSLILLQSCNILKGTIKDDLKPLPKQVTKTDLDDFFASYSIAIMHFYILYMNERFEEASIISAKLLNNPEQKQYLYVPISDILYFYGAMSSCAVCIKHGIRSNWKEILKCQKQIKEWSDISPNYLHQYYLVSAEIDQILGNQQEAIDQYLKSIEAAKKMGFIHEEALAKERLALFYLKIGRNDLAEIYIIEAYKGYLKWGAEPKVKSLIQTHYHFLEKFLVEDQLKTSALTTATTSALTSQSWDVESIIEVSQSISKEIILEKLIKTFMNIVLVNAGADKAVLFLETDGDLKIKAEILLNQEESTIFNNLSLESREDHFCLSAVNYVWRSHEFLVLNNACERGLLNTDPYVLNHRLQSLAALPLIQQNKLMGVLYLENNSSKGAFSDNRIRLLTLLSSQITISLENARFFERMNRLYRSTERFVPKSFLDLLHKESVEEVHLGDGVEMDVSVQFTDLRNFTSIVQSLTPKAAFKIVNQYLAFMAPIVRDHYGFINMFMGDGILAIYTRKVEDSINAGLALLASLEAFNRKQREVGEIELSMGVAISTGKAMLGIIGEKERMEPSVISDVANTSARIESLNKTYNTHFLISEDTYKNIGFPHDYILRRIDKVYLMGRNSPTNIYEVINWEGMFPELNIKEYLQLFQAAFESYEKGNFNLALKQFAICQSALPQDPVTELLIKRSELFLREGVPKNWDGTFVFTHK